MQGPRLAWVIDGGGDRSIARDLVCGRSGDRPDCGDATARLMRWWRAWSTASSRCGRPAHAVRDAAWHNWSTVRPISFLSAFPLRIDGEQFELHEEPADNAAQVLGCLVTLMAATARNDARIDLADRLRGRVMMPRMANAALRSLVKQARRYGPTFGTDDLSRATARFDRRIGV